MYYFCDEILNRFLDLLFPSFCVLCNKEGNFLCDSCKQKIVVQRLPDTHRKYGLHSIYAATEYSQPIISKLIGELKYHGVKDIHEIVRKGISRPVYVRFVKDHTTFTDLKTLTHAMTPVVEHLEPISDVLTSFNKNLHRIKDQIFHLSQFNRRERVRRLYEQKDLDQLHNFAKKYSSFELKFNKISKGRR